MSTATIGRSIHKPTAKKRPSAPAESIRHLPAASAAVAELPIDVEACGTLYDTVLSCTLDIEDWTSD